MLRKLLSNIIALMMHSIIASRRLERKRLNSFLTVLTDQSPQALFRKRSELMKGLAGITWTVLEKAIISSCLWLIK